MRAHGTRARYAFGPVGQGPGCRCGPCTEANRVYARDLRRRQHRPDGGWTPAYVDCTEARDHLLWLRSVGVGLRTVHQQTGINRSVLAAVVSARRTRLRPRTIGKILAVGRSAAHGKTLVDARPTWRHIERLLAAGWTKAAISKAIGNNGRALQLGRNRVTAENARKVAELAGRALLRDDARRANEAERRRRYRGLERAS